LIDFIILGFLMEKDMSGYDIKQIIGLSTANFYAASFGSIYPALKRLESNGLITVTELVDSGKFRKMYRILETGRQNFIIWLQEPLILHPTRNEWLVKLFFYRHLPVATVLQLLDHFLLLLAMRQKTLSELEPLITGKADFFQFSTFHYGKDYYQFLHNWTEQYIKSVEKEKALGTFKHE